MEITPLVKSEAYALVERWEMRHVKFHRLIFAIACRREGKEGTGEIVGVAIVGLPRAWIMDDGWTLEVQTFIRRPDATAETGVIESALEDAAWKAVCALGYRRMTDGYGTVATTENYDQSRYTPREQERQGKGERKTNRQSAMGGYRK